MICRSKLYLPEHLMLINPPRWLLLREALWQFCILLLLTALSVNVLMFVTIPTFVATVFYRYIPLSQIWRQYGYSRLVLWLLAALAFVLSICAAPLLREWMLLLFEIGGFSYE
ncbi:hypothetical protein [Paenibacillus spongiae]|uniref:Uncharacterized protein n=1 Tax=Paenibacillus spongiae TaxID=2909671 RepID=A0ABY5SIG8_9BACL|nr:hypothetical protein [Paenibacillus spongiae]UVI33434.1 hypothetical protein L1F29_17025 [Paenibacillus spongiae]